MKKSHVLVIFWLGLGNPCRIATKSPFCMVVVLVWKSWYLILLWARFTNELQLNTAIRMLNSFKRLDLKIINYILSLHWGPFQNKNQSGKGGNFPTWANPSIPPPSMGIYRRWGWFGQNSHNFPIYFILKASLMVFCSIYFNTPSLPIIYLN